MEKLIFYFFKFFIMKSTKFSFFLIFFLISFLGIDEIKSQHFKCGTPPPSEDDRADIIRKLRLNDANRSNGCTDPENNSSKTYKVVFEYAVKSDGTRYVTDDDFNNIIIPFIVQRYGQYNISFIFSYFPVLCDNCDNVDDAGWGRNNPTKNNIDFPDCIWGRIAPYNNDGVGGLANYNGKFYSNKAESTKAHELGHELGLRHTHFDFNPGRMQNNEHIIQNGGDNCPCNCRITGDFVCDTPVDPFINQSELPAVNNQFPLWNANMFDQWDDIENLGNESDFCGTVYNKTLIPMNTNLMSYNARKNPNYTLTPGQGSFIKAWNLGKPWETSGSAPPNAGPSMDPGFVVNIPMTISSPMNLTGDIIVNSHLTISNTVLGFIQDKGIIINAGGAITVDNSHLIPYPGAGCFPQAQYWKGIEVKTPSKVRIMIKNNSVIDRAFTAIKGHNCNIEGYIITGSRLNSYNYTALDILNNIGYFQVIERCIINGKIALENSIDGLRISSSSVTGPLFKVKSATLTILGSKIYSPLEIENMGSHTVRLYNSTFFNFVNANPLNGKGVVRDNTFKTSVNTFFNTLDLDMYNNTFEGNDGPTILGFRPINVLLFKNSMSSARYGIQNANFFSNTRIECNNFLTQGNNDLFLREPIATSQGNENIAAGNSFSRTPNLEVKYEKSQPISYFYHPKGKEEPISINTTSKFTTFPIALTSPSACDIKYPDTPPIPNHCKNRKKDGDETDVDCGGSCPPCNDVPPVIITPSNCINGIQDQGETGIDCGGPCPPCLVSCSNGIQDNGEYGVDCGGPCPPCVISTPPTCTDGIMNGNETGIDCGGPTCPPCPIGDPVRPTCTDGVMNGTETGIDCGGICPPCGTVVVYIPHCYNGVQDANETGIDCGGSCPPCVVVYPPHCYNGKKDGNESGIDCGGSCPPCGYYPPIGGSSGGNSDTGGDSGKYTKGDHTAFVQQLNAIYGNGFMTGERYQVSQDFAQHQATLDGGNTCSVRDFIASQSASQPAKVLEILTAISPNVSPAVIHALFEKSSYFTSSQVAQILALNPALLADAYVSGVVYKTNTFGTVDKNIILNAALANSSRVNAEVILSYKKQYQDAIIRDNIGMLSLNTPIDFNDIRAELATNPSPYRIFDIAQTYADQGRPDLATQTLAGADLCQITDPIYRSQLTGLSYIYSNWQGIQDEKPSSRSEVTSVLKDLISTEHGIATDIAAQVSYAEVKLKERWKYEPLVFATSSSTSEWTETNIEIYPNPAHDALNINVKTLDNTKNLVAQIINQDGRVMSEINIHNDRTNIDISLLNSGLYTVKVLNKNQTIFVSKFIKIQ
jgi:hypothetical protein